MDEIIKEFLVESHENLDRLDLDLIALEKEPTSAETLGSIFRTIHSLKGTSGFLGLGKLEAVAHVGENLLSKLRDGLLSISPEIISALLATVDAVRFMLAQIEATGSPGEKDFSSLVERLAELGGDAPAAETSIEEASTGRIEDFVPDPITTVQQPSPVATPPAEKMTSQVEGRAGPVSDCTIRVDVGVLDKLMNLVGELVLARNQVLQFSAECNDSAFLSTSQRLNLITTELQGSVMKTRMQPIGNVWSKLPRIVRDLAANCGKSVCLEMEGNETELDKTIIEAIKDPLTHIVRNAIDHGIESPGVRRELGKAEEGRLRMRAYHEGGQVNIEISDDGGGIVSDRVKQKAVQRGLITHEIAQRMTDYEAWNLIFLPGFSTAEKVTNVSGRGVGMDVVKTNIEKIGGVVDVQSQAGRGTTIKIKIPLTLAIIPALIVKSGGDRFAIPQVSLLELLRLDSSESQIETIHGISVYRLRGRLLPLVYLNRELQLRDSGSAKTGVVNIVVLQAERQPFGLVVDEINDTEEIVVKPLNKQLKGIAHFAGGTIMGDGCVALILDALGLAQGAGVVQELRDHAPAEAAPGLRRASLRAQTLLLFDPGQGGQIGIPLSMVARLEEFPLSAIERSGPTRVVRYRGQILPLIRVADHIASEPGPAWTEQDPMQVIVYSENERSIGLVVGRIKDIVEDTLSVKRHASGHGIFGSVVIHDRVTDLLDVKSVIRAGDPSFFVNDSAAVAA